MNYLELCILHIIDICVCVYVCGGWDREGGREAQEGGDMGIHVCIWLIHFAVHLKLTQHCKLTILQLEKSSQYGPEKKTKVTY